MVIKKLRYSGAYKMFMWLAKNLANQGFDITVYTYMKSDVEYLADNIHWIKTDLSDASFLTQLKSLKNVVKKTQADSCISFLLDANILNTLACIGTRTKSIICERNDPFKPGYYKLQFTKWMFRWADGAVFQLPKVKDFYSMVKGKTAIIPNPVLSDDGGIILQPFQKRKNKIVTLGRINIAQKRQDILIEAFDSFLKKHPIFELEIYGDGYDSDVKRIKSLIKNKHLEKKVHLKGITNNPKAVLNEAKFFVLSSDFEGIPNALIEAMTVGLPCIATDCRPGGAALLIDNYENGILVPVHDAEKLCDAMCYMVDNPDKANNLGENAKNIVETYSEKSIINKWISYLQNL